MPIGSNGIKQERVVYKLYHLAGFYSWLKTGFLLSVVFLSIISVVNAATLTAGDLAPRGSPNGQLDAADLHILQQFVIGSQLPIGNEFPVADVVLPDNS